MDEDQIQQCKHLKHKFNGVYAAENFPLKMSPNSFTIVNASPAASIGTHWLVLAKRYASPFIYFGFTNLADPLALAIYSYKLICDHLKGISADTIYVDLMDLWKIDEKPENPCNAQTRNCVDFFAYILLTIL